MGEKITTEQLAKKLIAFSVPLILSGLFQQLFNWIDALIVGNIAGETALAGIGVTTSLYHLFVTVTPANLFPYAREYMLVIFTGVPFHVRFNC